MIILTLTYVHMDNFLSLFLTRTAIDNDLLFSSVAIELPAVNRRQRQPQNPQQQAVEDGQFVVNLFHVY